MAMPAASETSVGRWIDVARLNVPTVFRFGFLEGEVGDRTRGAVHELVRSNVRFDDDSSPITAA